MARKKQTRSWRYAWQNLSYCHRKAGNQSWLFAAATPAIFKSLPLNVNPTISAFSAQVNRSINSPKESSILQKTDKQWNFEHCDYWLPAGLVKTMMRECSIYEWSFIGIAYCLTFHFSQHYKFHKQTNGALCFLIKYKERRYYRKKGIGRITDTVVWIPFKFYIYQSPF